MENKTLKEIFETIEAVDENKNCHFDMEELADMFTEVDKELKAYYELQEEHKQLEDNYEMLSKKYSLYDYWRNMVRKQDKILDVLKNHVYAIRNYIYTTDSKITEEEFEILKLWLDSNTK